MSPARGRAVVLGIAAQYPLAGVTWQLVHYLAGLRACGWDAWYVEDSGAPPYDPVAVGVAHAPAANVAYLAAALDRAGFGDRWAYREGLDGPWHGPAAARVDALYASADVLLNLCGATHPRPEHRRGGRLCYVETDPIVEQIRVARGDAASRAFLAAHDVCFTYAELLGTPACPIPTAGFRWHPTRPPVVPELWGAAAPAGSTWRSVATWENAGKDVEWEGTIYRWSKHLNFLAVLDLPRATGAALELAMDPLDPAVRARFAAHGWRLTDPRAVSGDVAVYRRWIEQARGECTVAKDVYVRPRSGWFSDRSVCFLAAGRPVVTQDTGFGAFLPTGRGLLAFGNAAEAAEAVRAVEADWDAHARAARAIAVEHFDARRVLGALLATAGAS